MAAAKPGLAFRSACAKLSQLDEGLPKSGEGQGELVRDRLYIIVSACVQQRRPRGSFSNAASVALNFSIAQIEKIIPGVWQSIATEK